jgi:hypothetical protein
MQAASRHPLLRVSTTSLRREGAAGRLRCLLCIATEHRTGADTSRITESRVFFTRENTD